jgi:hypothetical protein
MVDDGVLPSVEQSVSIRIIAGDLLPSMAPRHHAINGALKFDPQSPWNVGRSDARTPALKLTT